MTRDELVAAAKQADWMQVVLNQGPPCFHLQSDGRFCLRAQRWVGHNLPDDEWPSHTFVSLESLLFSALQGEPERGKTCAMCLHLKTQRDITDEYHSWCVRTRIDVTDVPDDFGCTLWEALPDPPPPTTEGDSK